MYQKICVALDGSPTSIHAFQAALKLAQTCGATLVAIHVVNTANLLRMGIGIGNEQKLLEEVAHTGHTHIAAALKGMDLGDVAMQMKIVPNHGDDIVTLLLKAVQEEDGDLIAMGTKGATGLLSLLVGSVAEGVLRQSPVPVLMVRQAHESN